MKILIIEDNKDLQNSIVQYLINENYIVEIASDFLSASEKSEIYEYDCIIVDITLPDGNGLDIIKKLKKNNSKAGIIIISAKNSLDDKIIGLDIGADDYISKPFHIPELNARIKALIRRKNFNGKNEINIEGLTLLPEDRRVFVNETEVILTIKEYDLLLYFISNLNRTITKSSIAEHLWGDNADQFDSFDFIYSHLKNLRKKLDEKGCPDYISTVYGIGYIFKTT